jgi:tRNA threonylcarbamoyladenosine biosynthesis protein TsaE
MSGSVTVLLPELAATQRLGLSLAKLLFPGSVVALCGPLGAGKTQLVRAVAVGLGVADDRLISSPTFVLVQEYYGRLPIYHFDAYRLSSAADFVDLGAWEYFASGGVCLIEWADRVRHCLPDTHLQIVFTVLGEDVRQVTLSQHGSGYEALLQQIRNDESFLVNPHSD